MKNQQSTLLSLTEIAEVYEQKSLAKHSFFERLGQEPFNPTAIWLFLENHRLGITEYSMGWLGSLIARIDDNRLRSLIAVQMNDELGKGDFPSIHLNLLQKMVAGFESWSPEDTNQDYLAPGRKLTSGFERLFLHSEDPYEGVGALIADEVLLEQVYKRLGQEIRRQNTVEPSALTWIYLHEGLEEDHKDDAIVMAQLADENQKSEAAWHGAEEMYTILDDFLNSLYHLCFA
ncbi:MAG: iron-containing redox enzyme family protein [Cyanobacteria bacterium P01_A01_bin.40]